MGTEDALFAGHPRKMRRRRTYQTDVVQALARAIVAAPRFQRFITALIIFAGILVGLETYPSIVTRYGTILHALDVVVLGVFIVEIVLKMVAEGDRPWRYFKDPWNVFDFVIVAAALLPFGGSAATVLRLLRLLRVLKLVRALPKLQLLVSALLKSIPSMAYVSLLLFLLFYVYAVAAVFMWGPNDPVHFGDLQIAMVSLFRAVTLEDWTDLMYTQMYGCDQYGYDGMAARCVAPTAWPVASPLYFVSFVLVGTMIILNLFIGVIMKGMEEAQAEALALDSAERTDVTVDGELDALQQELMSLHERLARVRALASAPALSGRGTRNTDTDGGLRSDSLALVLAHRRPGGP
ncbi:MAG: ion transporter [Myxococcota bacterium]